MSNQSGMQKALTILLTLMRNIQVDGGSDDRYSPSFTWPPMDLPSGPQPLEGIYLSLVIRSSFDAANYTTTITPGNDYVVFFRDGTVYRALPEEGLLNFKPAYWRRKNPSWWATYSFSSDRGSMTLEPGTDWTLSGTPQQLAINGVGNYHLLDSCDGMLLNGVFRRYDDNEYARQEIHFRSDGSFSDGGFLQAAGMSWWRPQGSLDDRKPGRGRYLIAKNSLELQYDDGRKRRVSFYILQDSKNTLGSSFYVNSWKFIRVK